MRDLKGILFVVFGLLVFVFGLIVAIESFYVHATCNGYLVNKPLSNIPVCIDKPEGK